MKLGFLILAHSDINQLKRLCSKLIDYGHLYIHVDKKTNSTYYRQLVDYVGQKGFCDNVTILKNRVNVFWGGYSMVRAIEALLVTALNDDQPKYDRLFLISGLCYPLFSYSQFLRFCEEKKNMLLFTAYNITQSDSKSQKQRVTLYHFFRDIKLPNSLFRRGIIAGSRMLFKYLQLRKMPYLIVNGVKWDIYYSSTWVSLTDVCWRYVLDHLQHNTKLIRYLETASCPDEMVIPTIIMNSDYRKLAFECEAKGLENLSMLHYLHYTDHIWTYNEKDFETLIKSDKPFVRKLVSGKSEKLIKMINSYHEQLMI